MPAGKSNFRAIYCAADADVSGRLIAIAEYLCLEIQYCVFLLRPVPSMTILLVSRGGVMSSFATTRLSTKGQVVIPEEIRKALGLQPGARFIVLGDKDVVILKSISVPSVDEFRELVSQARAQAAQAGLTELDIRESTADARTGQ